MTGAVSQSRSINTISDTLPTKRQSSISVGWMRGAFPNYPNPTIAPMRERQEAFDLWKRRRYDTMHTISRRHARKIN